MKEATGELNMTLVTIIAIAAVLAFVTFFLPGILNTVGNKWNDAEGTQCIVNDQGQTVCSGGGVTGTRQSGSGSGT